MNDQEIVWWDKAVDRYFGYLLFGGIIAILSGPILFLYECLIWLKSGVWTQYRVDDAFIGFPHTEWVGLQYLSDKFQAAPLPPVLFFLSVVVAYVLFSFTDYISNRASAIKRVTLAAEQAVKREKAESEREEIAARERRKEENRKKRYAKLGIHDPE